LDELYTRMQFHTAQHGTMLAPGKQWWSASAVQKGIELAGPEVQVRLGICLYSTEVIVLFSV